MSAVPQPPSGKDQPKKKRKRLKHICAQIRDQMEFYFSDANLHKDRFLKQLVEQDESGYVPLETFSKFNKLRNITTDMVLVAKALSTSQLLQVNEDKTHVRRVTPLANQVDTDDRTVYVENLPSSADHDWLKSEFSAYGKVVYVSIPRYKTTRDIKGFAFIEFDTVLAARKACQRGDDIHDEVLGKFPKMSKAMRELRKQAARVAEPEEIDAAIAATVKHSGESSCDKSENMESDEPATKKVKGEAVEGDVVSAGDTTETEQAKTVSKDSQKNGKNVGASQGANTEQKSTSSPEAPQKSVEIKRKHSERDASDGGGDGNDAAAATSGDEGPPAVKRRKQSNDDDEDDDGDTGETSEDERSETGESKGRNAGENLKRSCSESEDGAREAKRVRISDHIQVKDVPRKKKKRKRKEVEKEKDKNKEEFGLRVISKAEWLKLREEYLSLQKSSMKQLKQVLKNRQIATTEKKPERKKLEFIPNVIVKVTSSNPSKRSNIKELCSSVGEVSYIQWTDDDTSGYVRCPDATNATRISAASHEGLTYTLLQGDDEKRYWEKINADREAKLSQPSRKKIRGTQKIIEKAEKCMGGLAPSKHMFFDD